MKGAVAAAAVAAMAVGANASYAHRRAHDIFRREAYGETCVPGCTTIWTTVTGSATLVPNPPPATSNTPIATSSSVTPQAEAYTSPKAAVVSEAPTTEVTIPAAATSTEVVVVVPTPKVQTNLTPGTYTFPATTITVTDTTTVCGAETTKVPSGTYTLGGVTTIVETETTVTCPYAKETEVNGVVTSVIDTTVYVCPSAGTYTIAPVTKSCTEETVIVYPVPTSYAPGTYTASASVVTVTETGYVYYCPYASQGLASTTAVEAAATTVAATSKVPTVAASVPAVSVAVSVPAVSVPAVSVAASVPAVSVAVSVPVSSVVKQVASVSKVVSSAVASATSSSSSSGSSLQSSNDHYGITYTPYDSTTGNCKSATAVKADILILKNLGFNVVRVYSTDCDTLANVGGAVKEYGMKLILGVFVKSTGCTYETSDIKTQVDAIASWAQWDLVDLFVVGNEAIANGYCSATQLQTLITTVKSKCSSYTGPYTISETLNIWQETSVSSVICPVVDVTGANIHPYFNADTEPSAAGTFVKSELDLLSDICSGNEVINLECGWPTAGNCNGVACPGTVEQATAIAAIRAAAGDKTVFFSYENDLWKEPGTCDCERSWGSKSCF